MSDVTMVDTMIKDGLTDAFLNIHMGNTADHVAEKFSISREDQDKHALGSQMKYKEASQHFANEIGMLKKSFYLLNWLRSTCTNN